LVTRAGRPVTDYTLAIIPVAPAAETKQEHTRREGNMDHVRPINDPKGAFAVPRIAPGRYDITVNTADGLLARALDVTIEEGQTRRLRLVAEPGGVVFGRVVEEGSQKPIADATVSVAGRHTSQYS
jgi:hypothetical protein